MDSVARSLPALWRADKLQSKAAKSGFEFADVSGALDKLDEETRELRAAVETARILKKSSATCSLPPSRSAASAASTRGRAHEDLRKIHHPLPQVEEAVAARGQEMDEVPLDELTALWNAAKRPQ